MNNHFFNHLFKKIARVVIALFFCVFSILPFSFVNASSGKNFYSTDNVLVTISEEYNSYENYDNQSPSVEHSYNFTTFHISAAENLTGNIVLKISPNSSQYEISFIGCNKVSLSSNTLTISLSNTNSCYFIISQLTANTGSLPTLSSVTSNTLVKSSESKNFSIQYYQVSCYALFNEFGINTPSNSKPYLISGNYSSVSSNVVGIAPTQTIYLDFYSSKSIWVDSAGNTNLSPITVSNSNITYSIRNIDIVATDDGAYFYHIVFNNNSDNIIYFYFNIDTFISQEISIYPVYFGLSIYFPDSLKYMIGETSEQGVANTWLQWIYLQLTNSSSSASGLDDKSSELSSSVTDMNNIESDFTSNFSTDVEAVRPDISSLLGNTNFVTTAQWVREQLGIIFDSMGLYQLLFILPMVFGILLFFLGRGFLLGLGSSKQDNADYKEPKYKGNDFDAIRERLGLPKDD